MSTVSSNSSCSDTIYNAVGIFLVSAGTGGDRLLFRYPVDIERNVEPRRRNEFLGKNYYAVRITEDYQVQSKPQQSSIQNGVLVGYQDKDLANLLAVKTNMCNCKFEVKINDVIFVGYPVTLETAGNKRELSVLSVQVVFALTASVTSDVIACYCDLSKQIALALLHEEKRVGYLSAMKEEMWRCQDELASQSNPGKNDNAHAIMLKRKCRLALQLQAIFDSVCETGTVHVYINSWVAVNFALPHKIHDTTVSVVTRQKRDIINHCIKVLRPYHAMLLLMSSTDILASLPLDSSPSLMRLIKVCSPLKSMQQLASDADLSLSQVYQLVCHLVYWGHAIIIYPLCETNVYMLSVHVDTSPNSQLAFQFAEAFPNVSLVKVMADFSLPQPLVEHTLLRHDKLVTVVIWLLQRRILAQLHKYVFFVPPAPKAPRSRTLTDSDQGLSQRSIGEWTGGHRTIIEALLGSQRTITESGSSHLSLPLPRAFSDCTSVHSDESGMVSTADDSVPADEGLVRQQLDKMSMLDRQAVLGVAAAHSADDLALFLRLLPYMNGEHHLEEIMYYENMRRSQLTTVLDKFRDVIVTCEHADLGLNP